MISITTLPYRAAQQGRGACGKRLLCRRDRQACGNIGRLLKTASTDIILYLGCATAGWATSLDGRDAVLLGIEKIIELNWQDESAMQALIFHEIGHIWYKKPTGISIPRLGQRAKNSLAQLYQEGLAMVCEHILCQDDRYYHQIKNGYQIGKENEAEIKREYLRRVR